MKICLYANDGYKLQLVSWYYADGVFRATGELESPDGSRIQIQDVQIRVDKGKAWLEWLKKIDGSESEVSWQTIFGNILTHVPVSAFKQIFQAFGGLMDVAKAGRK